MRTDLRFKILSLLVVSALALGACSTAKEEQPYADSVVEGQGQTGGAGEGMLGDGSQYGNVQGTRLAGRFDSQRR